MTGGTTIVALEARDIRFPTSRWLDGSDAMHTDPDYSAAYVVLRTGAADGLEGHGLTFTSGRGTEVCVAAARALEPLVVGRTIEAIVGDMRGFWRSLVSDTQLRWLGPEKGVIHLATAAVVNAVWDLWAKREGKPLWKLLVDLSPEELVGCVDFRYIADVLSPDEALQILRDARRGSAGREAEIVASGYPAYTTSAGWLGYEDEKVELLVAEAVASGFTHVKMKVGADLESDDRRAGMIRRALGPDGILMMDANQVWGVDEAIAAMRRLAAHEPWWIEEPTSPDDVLGHARIRREVAPIRVATGEHVQNRVIFKQLFQAEAIDICQLDACRIGGVNEAIAVLLLAAKYGIPVCPHAGGVGLCEYVQHLAFFDYIAVSGSLEHRVVEWVDHLHEHFRDPAVVRDGRYVTPQAPGYSIEMLPESLDEFEFPNGPAWAGVEISVGGTMTVTAANSERPKEGTGGLLRLDRYRLLQGALLSLRAGPALILLLLIVAVSVTTPVFMTSRNIGNVFSQTSVIAVLALGQLLVIVSRGIDLSVGSTIALSGVVGAIVWGDTGSSLLTILAILGTGVAVGAANGLIFVYGRVPHPFIVTLATLSVVRGLALWISHGTLISGMPPIVQTIGGGSIGWLPYSIFVVIGLALLCLLLTTRLVWGRWLYAVGGSPEAARRASIPTRRVLVTVYILSGFAAGVAGLLVAGLIDAGSPTSGDLAELDSIAAVIIGGAAFAGGRGNVGNALVGAFTIGVIRNALNLHNVDAFYQLMAIGIILLAAVEADVLRGYIEGRVRVMQATRHA